MWNRDAGMPFDDGKPTGKNVYGTHPFYMYKNSPGTWVGVFTKLAAAQDWYLKNDKPTGKVDVTLIAAGGMADIYYIVDSEPGAVAASYLDLVGKPVLIPQWALGWH
jgi:alpha-glucosidase (family GH31 glycosyl hydrolase)